MEFAKLPARHLARCSHQQVLRLLVHREKGHLAQIGFVAQHHDDAVDAGRNAAMRRGAEMQRPVHPAEFVLEHLFRITCDLEGPAHHVGAMVADGARGQLNAVADDVVLKGEDVEGVHAVEGIEAALRHGERVVREVDLVLLLVPFVHREIHDPAELESVLIHKIELASHPVARLAGEFVELVRPAGGEENRIPDAEIELAANGFAALGPDIAGDRAGTALLALAPEYVSEPRLALTLSPAVHAVAEGAAAALRRRNGPDLHLAILGNHGGEHLEARAGKVLGDIRQLEGIAQIRLVRAIFADRLLVGNARELRRHRPAVGEFLEHPLEDRLDRVEDVILVDEAHLDIELVEFARRAVGPGVLVAEAGSDLEIAVEARDHDQLLELLRRLRQRVELPRMEPARHQEVAGAFRARGRENWCLELEEPLRPHAAAQTVDDRTPPDDVAVEALAAQVEKTIAQTDVFGIFLVAEHRQRQLGRFRKDGYFRGKDLDLAGRELGVVGALRPWPAAAGNLDHPFRAQHLGDGESGRIRIHHDLGDAVMVSEIDEFQAAMVTHAVDPAGEANVASRIGEPQLAASVCPVAAHRSSSARIPWHSARGLEGMTPLLCQERRSPPAGIGLCPRKPKTFLGGVQILAICLDFHGRLRLPEPRQRSLEIVTSTQALESLCSQLSQEDFVTVDTEFMREQTYWPELCLVQIAGAEHEAIIDPLAPHLELEPFWQLMVDSRVVKVFHAARQDVEIVYSRAGVIPTPLFDTQVAAMV